jgi:hypothetical protein
MAEDISDITPYNYGLNNPVLMIDADGREADNVADIEQSKPKPKPKPKPKQLPEVKVTATRIKKTDNSNNQSWYVRLWHWYSNATARPYVPPSHQTIIFLGFGEGLASDFDEAPIETPASTPVGKLGDEMKNLPVRNKPTTINGVEFTGHALDQMQARGVISPTAVIDAVQNGITSPGNTAGESVHTSLTGDLKVVTNTAGTKIITVIPQSFTPHLIQL